MLGLRKDPHVYATVAEYQEGQFVATDNILQKLKRATGFFDKMTGREGAGRWLKSRPLSFRAHGRGHPVVHFADRALLCVRNIIEDGTEIVTSASTEIPGSGSPALRVDSKVLSDTYESFKVQISNTESTFDLEIYNDSGVQVESYSDLTLEFDSPRYCRRVVNRESDIICLALFNNPDLPDEGEYVLEGYSNEYDISFLPNFLDGRSAGYDFLEGTKNIVINGEFGDQYEPNQDVIFATCKLVTLIEEDEMTREDEIRYHETPREDIIFESLTGSTHVDTAIENYMVKGSSTYLDIR